MAKDKNARKPRQTSVPSDETKAAKFKRLASARTTKAILTMRNLAKLGGPNYERTAEQQKKIVDVLQAEVHAVQKALVPHVPGVASTKTEGPLISL